MKRLIYCLRLAWLDLTRLWSSTQHHVVIVAGIVLPLLLLMGLKRGHVAELRKELLRSPIGRQVVIWSTREDALLDQQTLDRLASELADVELLIPESERVAEISRVGASGQAGEKNDPGAVPVFSTIYPTSPGDPILRQSGLDVLRPDESSIIVSEFLAEKLKLKIGDRLSVTLTRTGVTAKEKAVTSLEVKGILPQPNEKSAIGYVDLGLVNLFERWIRGGGVEQFGWPASERPAADRYAAYLMFVERPSSPSEDDFQTLADRGLAVAKLEDLKEASLLGLIPKEKMEKLDVWKITPSTAAEDPSARLSLSPSELEGLTGVDDMIVPWNPPRNMGVNSPLLVGLTLPNRSRLRASFLPHPGMAFKAGEDLNEIILVDSIGRQLENPPATVDVTLPNAAPSDGTLKLKVRVLPPSETDAQSDSDKTTAESQVAEPMDQPAADKKESKSQSASASDEVAVTYGIMPCQLLARLDAIEQRRAVFDQLTQTIVQVPEPPRFGKARLYATEIDRIPRVVEELQARGFAVLSESGRIAEIQQQDNSLQLLVWIVGLGVLLFGILTVFSVLVDSTERKRGTIGILRVMGVSRFGIFLMVVIRAASIGLIAGFGSLVAGWLLGMFFGWVPPTGIALLRHKPVMSILFDPVDLTIVLLGAVLCSCLGALLPAWRAAKVDPFDAIVEGRFK